MILIFDRDKQVCSNVFEAEGVRLSLTLESLKIEGHLSLPLKRPKLERTLDP